MATRDPDCLFCKIIAGEIPAAVVRRTDRAVAFLDIRPVNRGHVLVVPTHHHRDLAELPEDDAAHLATLLPGLVRAIRAATGAPALNVVVNNGEAAGQTIFHGHWHLIPRFPDDPVNWPWPHAEYVGDELGQMRFRIERELSGNADD